ncbi:hypothetical protein AUC68_12695 [Methyloceanibacter methanicus]|uniref:Uncharacterized protein n=1 Tax=Methyloceanibacter methanicus TaxID=1774968 RepID=A0A1E3W5W1_9HYPH|nr:hypothetical protein [Methyloceanibacter methanicus]ODS01215.1 hypothetical protein AUC68_12695 [Methyloceanibacter methanicus]
MRRNAALQNLKRVSFMPLSFGPLGKAVAILIIAAFVLWLIFTYMFATEEAAEDAEQVGALSAAAQPLS